MANRRFAVHEIRHILARMRLGESDREIAKARLMGRDKAAKLRRLAKEHGWLDKASPLPDNEIIGGIVRKGPPVQCAQSLVLPYAKQVLAWHQQGIQATTIHDALVRTHGFTGGYDAVKRFLRRQKKEGPPATVMLDHKPGEAAQVDFGSGPKIVDLTTGEVRDTWVFVMTQAWSRHVGIKDDIRYAGRVLRALQRLSRGRFSPSASCVGCSAVAGTSLGVRGAFGP